MKSDLASTLGQVRSSCFLHKKLHNDVVSIVVIGFLGDAVAIGIEGEEDARSRNRTEGNTSHSGASFTVIWCVVRSTLRGRRNCGHL